MMIFDESRRATTIKCFNNKMCTRLRKSTKSFAFIVECDTEKARACMPLARCKPFLLLVHKLLHYICIYYFFLYIYINIYIYICSLVSYFCMISFLAVYAVHLFLTPFVYIAKSFPTEHCEHGTDSATTMAIADQVSVKFACQGVWKSGFTHARQVNC